VRALVDVTNRVGVDVNLAFRSKHKSHVLQFVAGLGPRKAKQLLLNMPGKGGHLESRGALVEKMYEWVGRHVFTNVAGFLRIIDKNESEPEVLDDTRVHPAQYDKARWMAASALDCEDEEDSFLCTEVMKPENCLKLNDLDLDAYCKMLEEEGQSGLRETLYDIKDELQFPFREVRRPFEPPSEMQTFTLLTGETKDSMFNTLIDVTVDRIVPGRSDSVTVYCKLDNGMRGILQDDKISSRGPLTLGEIEKCLHVGQLLQCCVIQPPHRRTEELYKEFTVFLSSRRCVRAFECEPVCACAARS
jgi:transcription elongation factor SPT6